MTCTTSGNLYISAEASSQTPIRPAEFYWTAAIALLWLMVTYVLTPPAHLRPSLDAGWQAVLVEAFLRHAQSGKDIVFNYGPWGFLDQPRGNLAIYPWLVFGRLILALGFGIGTAWVVTISRIRSRLLRWAYLLLVLAWANPVLLVPFTLFLVLFESGGEWDWRQTLSICLLVPACALAAHVKMTVFPLLVLLVPLLLFYEVFVRKRPWLLASLVAAYFAWYLAGSQSIGSYWAYISNSVSLASAYNFTLFESNGPASTLFVGLLLCAAMVLCYLAAVSHAKRWALLPGGLWIAAYFFLGFKEAFVRHDNEHLWVGLFNIAIPASMLLVLRLREYPLLHIDLVRLSFANTAFHGGQIIIWFVMALCMFFSYHVLRSHTMLDAIRATLEKVPEISPALFSSQWRSAQYSQERAALRTRYRLAPLKGGVDILPADDFWLLANSLHFQPRPVFQSNVVMNERLARLNADFLTGPAAPDYVLIDAQTDGGARLRYPSMQDNLAWLSLLSHYDPASFSGGYLVLKKSQSHDLESQDLGTQTISWQQPVKIPSAAGLIWAEINVSTRPVGLMSAMLLRPEPIVLRLETGGQIKEYRFLTLLGKAGFLLSPVVNDPASFAALYMGSAGRGLLREVSNFSLTTGFLGRLTYSPAITVHLKHLSVRPRSTAGLISSEFRSLAESMSSSALLNRPVASPAWRVEDGHLMLQVQPPSRGEIPLASPGRMHFRIGVRNDCQGLADVSSTIEFRAVLKGPTGAEEALFQRQLSTHDEMDVSEDAQVYVPHAGKLALETAFHAGTCPVGAYWSDVDFIQP